MKKSFVAALILLALIVLVSPGIVGRLAEKSMDENLDWAATANDEVLITSQGFDRGWFSSAGQHRVEVRDGQLRDVLRSFAGPDNPAGLPALVIDTRLDHGLIPVASMSREGGSLLPGLGSAVSTMRIEFDNGLSVDLPGVIYSTVGISGEMQSDFTLEPGTIDLDQATLHWGQSDIRVTSNPNDGNIDLRGKLDPLSVESPGETVLIGEVSFTAEQAPSSFGFAVGNIDAAIDSINLIGDGEAVMVGPLSLASSTSVQGDRVSGSAEFRIDNAPVEAFGPANIVVDVRFENADGASLGKIRQSLDALDAEAAPGAMHFEQELQDLLAAGLELNIEQMDVSLPSGAITVRSNIKIAESDRNSFSWPGAMLATDATLNLTLPGKLVNMVIAMKPEANALIGLGYLRQQGDKYEMRAQIEDGVLTINGAPMNLPLGALQ